MMSRLHLLIGGVLVVSPMMVLMVNASTTNEELRSVKQEIRKKQSLVNKTRKVEAVVSSELQEISRSLAAKERELKQLDRELSEVENSIIRTGQEIGKATEEAQSRQRKIERRLVSLYKAGELGALRMFFSADSFPQMAENVRYMGAILEHDKRIFSEYRKKIEELSLLKKRFEAEAARKEHLIGNIASKKKEIEAEKNKKGQSFD